MSRRLVFRASCLCFALATPLAYGIEASPAGTRGGRYLALHLLLSALMLAAALAGRNLGPKEQSFALWSGVAARLLLVGCSAFTTHDVSRYLWDGAVAAAGLDPYRVAPLDAAAAALRDHWPVAPEHLRYVTLYPPAAIAVFAACAAAGPALAFWAWKAVVVAAGLGVLAVTRRLLVERDLAHNLPWVALSPLLVLETGVGTHLDVLPALALVLALRWHGRGHPAWAGAMLGLGALFKFVPAAAALPLAARGPGRARAALLGTTAAVWGLGYGLGVAAGLRPLGCLPVFFEKWRFGSPFFAALGRLVPPEHALPCAALAALALLAFATHASRKGGQAQGVALATAAPLATSPVLFPWYALPVAPLFALAPSAAGLAWLTALPLTYEVIDAFDASGTWAPSPWPLVVIAAAVLAGAALDQWLARPRRAGEPAWLGLQVIKER